MDLKDVLTNIGLSDKEAKVYLAALELGPSPASDIALRARLNRVTTYDILTKLTQKGFINPYMQNRIKYFAPLDPDIVRSDYRQKYMNLKTALPELRRLHGKTAHPRIRYYEGIEGVKKVYADTLTSKTEILNYTDSKAIWKFWPNYDHEYVKERARRKIYLRGITPRSEISQEMIEKNKETNREIRVIDPDKFSFENEINIYDDKVAIISFGEDEILGMIIENPEIANTQRSIFMMAWEFADRG